MKLFSSNTNLENSTSLQVTFNILPYARHFSAPAFSCFASNSTGIVVDVGFSCTTISAFFDGQPIKNCVLRIDLGGKMLTNQLKDWISYRYVNVMEETYVVNELKEDCCFVSTDSDKDMIIAQLVSLLSHNCSFSRYKDERNTIRREYVLPDFMERHRGYIYEPGVAEKPNKVDGQIIPMNHERFMLPEALFRSAIFFTFLLCLSGHQIFN